MPVMLELAFLLFKSPQILFMPNRSVGLNIIAITAGVAFLSFAITIYDSYKERVERIIFSLTPQITLKSISYGGGPKEDALDDATRCEKICRAPFAVYQGDADIDATQHTEMNDEQMEAVETWLAAASSSDSQISANWVIFEELVATISTDRKFSTTQRRFRVLGIKRVMGTTYSPSVDLVFRGREVEERFERGEGILISSALASELGQVSPAAETTTSPSKFDVLLGIKNKTINATVISTHRLGIHSISKDLIIAPYDTAVRLLGHAPDKLPSYLGIAIDNINAVDAVAAEARRQLRPEDVTALAWTSISDLFDQLALYRGIIIVALSLSILVTSINTMVNMNILIMQRTRDIGIIKAMGLSPSRLVWIFIIIGLLQSLIGATLGYGIGLISGFLLNDYINELVKEFIPIERPEIVFSPMLFLLLFTIVATVSVAACVIAARRAVMLKIAENLRGA